MNKNEFSANWLLNERHEVILNGELTGENHIGIIAQMQYLRSVGEEPTLCIDCCPGGSVIACMAIYDEMQRIKPRVIVRGMAASAASLLLAAGAKGKRFAYPNAIIMIHQPLGGFQGQASDIRIQWERMEATKRNLNLILSIHTGQPLEKIERDTDRDYYMSAEEALKYGIIDGIIYPEDEEIL